MTDVHKTLKKAYYKIMPGCDGGNAIAQIKENLLEILVKYQDYLERFDKLRQTQDPKIIDYDIMKRQFFRGICFYAYMHVYYKIGKMATSLPYVISLLLDHFKICQKGLLVASTYEFNKDMNDLRTSHVKRIEVLKELISNLDKAKISVSLNVKLINDVEIKIEDL